MLGECAQQLHIIRRDDSAASPSGECALLDGQGFIGHDEFGVGEGLNAEPVASRTAAARTIKRKESRLYFFDREAGDRTRKAFGENCSFGLFRFFMFFVGLFDDSEAISEAQSGFKTIGESVGGVFFDDDAIDDEIDIMFDVFIEFGWGFEVIELAIDFEATEALFKQAGHFAAIFAFAGSSDRRHQEQAGVFRQARTRSTISVIDWLSIGRPVAGE